MNLQKLEERIIEHQAHLVGLLDALAHGNRHLQGLWHQGLQPINRLDVKVNIASEALKAALLAMPNQLMIDLLSLESVSKGSILRLTGQHLHGNGIDYGKDGPVGKLADTLDHSFGAWLYFELFKRNHLDRAASVVEDLKNGQILD